MININWYSASAGSVHMDREQSKRIKIIWIKLDFAILLERHWLFYRVPEVPHRGQRRKMEFLERTWNWGSFLANRVLTFHNFRWQLLRVCSLHIFCCYGLWQACLFPGGLLSAFLRVVAVFSSVVCGISFASLFPSCLFSQGSLFFILTDLLWGKTMHRCLGRGFWSTSK